MLIRLHKLWDDLKKSPAKKDKLITILSILALLVNILIWSLIHYKLQPTMTTLQADQTYIPLHYNIYTGIDNFGNWKKIFHLPLIGLIVIVINILFSFYFYNKKKIVAYFLSTNSLFIQIILLIATLLIILLNL